MASIWCASGLAVGTSDLKYCARTLGAQATPLVHEVGIEAEGEGYSDG